MRGISRLVFILFSISILVASILIPYLRYVSPFQKLSSGASNSTCNANCFCEKDEVGKCYDCAYNFTDNKCNKEELDWIAKNIDACQHTLCFSECVDLLSLAYKYTISNPVEDDLTPIKNIICTYNCSYLCKKVYEYYGEEVAKKVGCVYIKKSEGKIIKVVLKDDICG